ncbi:MAG TPA: hypothetical protein VGG62_06900 [Terracidiphilus sp.]|jgi:hypothetical protein
MRLTVANEIGDEPDECQRRANLWPEMVVAIVNAPLPLFLTLVLGYFGVV